MNEGIQPSHAQFEVSCRNTNVGSVMALTTISSYEYCESATGAPTHAIDGMPGIDIAPLGFDPPDLAFFHFCTAFRL